MYPPQELHGLKKQEQATLLEEAHYSFSLLFLFTFAVQPLEQTVR